MTCSLYTKCKEFIAVEIKVIQQELLRKLIEAYRTYHNVQNCVHTTAGDDLH